MPAFHARGVVDLYAELFERSLPRGLAGLVVALAFVALVLLGASRLWRDPGRGRLCALAATVPVGSTALLWLLGPHIFQPRALIGAMPFAAVALAAGLAVPWRRATVAASGVALLLLVGGFARATGRIVPDYDRVAHALVAQGWNPESPILVFGSLYDYLHPLDWYLPGNDRLEVATPTAQPCSRVFVVAVGGQARALTTQARTRARRIRRTVVVSLPWRASLWHEMRARDGHVLATRRARCAQPHAPPGARGTP